MVVDGTELEYIVRRFTLEKGYAVLAHEGEDGQPVIRSLDPSRFESRGHSLSHAGPPIPPQP